MIRRLLTLIGCCTAFWAIASLVAQRIWGAPAAAYAGIAMTLCLVPAIATLCWANWALRQTADQQFTMLLGGTGVRVFVVLIGAFILNQSVPYLQQPATPTFLMWVLMSYMVTLIAETALTLSAQPAKTTDQPA